MVFMRMNAPCRASTCDHLQCFDAQLYLQMNEKKPKWVCPVCNKPALVENLLVDGFFLELIRSPRLPPDEHEIVLHNDGTWDPLPPKKDDYAHVSKPPPPSLKVMDTLSIGDSDNDTTPTPTPGPSGKVASKRLSSDSVDCITLDSDSEDEFVPPPKKRLRIESSSDSQSNKPPGSPDLICLDDD